MAPENLETRLEELEIRGRIGIIVNIGLIESVKTIRRILKI